MASKSKSEQADRATNLEATIAAWRTAVSAEHAAEARRARIMAETATRLSNTSGGLTSPADRVLELDAEVCAIEALLAAETARRRAARALADAERTSDPLVAACDPRDIMRDVQALLDEEQAHFAAARAVAGKLVARVESGHAAWEELVSRRAAAGLPTPVEPPPGHAALVRGELLTYLADAIAAVEGDASMEDGRLGVLRGELRVTTARAEEQAREAERREAERQAFRAEHDARLSAADDDARWRAQESAKANADEQARVDELVAAGRKRLLGGE